MSQKYVREMIVRVSIEDIQKLLPAGATIEDIRTDTVAGGEQLMIRVSHLKAPIMEVGSQLHQIGLREFLEDFR